MASNRPEFLTQLTKTAATIAGWIAVYLLGSYFYFAVTYHLIEGKPALLIPSLMPLSALSAWVSWQIEEEIEPVHGKAPGKDSKATILPLLYMSVFYSSVVEGFL